jgi:hypothetical protein
MTCNSIFSARDGLNLLRYALKRLSQDPEHPLSKDARLARSTRALSRRGCGQSRSARLSARVAIWVATRYRSGWEISSSIPTILSIPILMGTKMRTSVATVAV